MKTKVIVFTIVEVVSIVWWVRYFGWSYWMIPFFGLAPSLWLLGQWKQPAKLHRRPQLRIVPRPEPSSPEPSRSPSTNDILREGAEALLLASADCPCTHVVLCDSGRFRFCQRCGRDIWGSHF